MKYKVGQIFYLVGSETARVIPFRIIEEITRTTLDGVEKSFMAELPDENKTKIDVAKLKGEVFENIRDVKSHMLANATAAIEKMLDSALKIAEHVYQVEQEQVEEEVAEEKQESVSSNTSLFFEGTTALPADESNELAETSSVQSEGESDIVKVDIGNGVMANVNLSELNKVRL